MKVYDNGLSNMRVINYEILNRQTGKQLVLFSISNGNFKYFNKNMIQFVFMPSLSRIRNSGPLTKLFKLLVMYSILPDSYNGSNLAEVLFDKIKIYYAHNKVPVGKFMGAVLQYNLSMFVLSVLLGIVSRNVKITGEQGILTLEPDGTITTENLKGFLNDYKVALTGAEKINLYQIS